MKETIFTSRPTSFTYATFCNPFLNEITGEISILQMWYRKLGRMTQQVIDESWTGRLFPFWRCWVQDATRLPPAGHFSISESSCSCREANCWSTNTGCQRGPAASGWNDGVNEGWLGLLLVLIRCFYHVYEQRPTRSGWKSCRSSETPLLLITN